MDLVIKTIAFIFTIFLSLSSYASNMTSFNTSGYISVKHGKLFYQKFGRGKIPIIIVHGDPRLGHSYLLPQMLSLANDNEIIFYDQRGSGKSQNAEISPEYITLNQFIDDLESLRKQLGIKKFILLGHSLGGPLAMAYAIKHPERVSALILVSSTPVDEKGQQAFETEFTRVTLPIKSEIAPLYNEEEFKRLTTAQLTELYKTVSPRLFYNPLDAAKLTLQISSQSAKNGDSVIRMMANSFNSPENFDLLSSLKNLKIPTLILHGKQDAIPLWTAQTIKNAIPDAQLIVFDKCGHFPYIEEPEQFSAYVHNFLKKYEL